MNAAAIAVAFLLCLWALIVADRKGLLDPNREWV